MSLAAPPGPAGSATPYLDAALASVARARTANRATLGDASRLLADVLASARIIHVFGSGHSQRVALEVSQRAGGLAPLDVIFDPTWGMAEHVEGYGQVLLRNTRLDPADCLVIISNSGTTAAAIEIALAARAAGTAVVAVVSRSCARATPVRHTSGLRLHELARIVLDTGTPTGDETIRLPGLAVALGPASTIVAAALLHETIVGAVARLVDRGIAPPLFRSNAESGGAEHNRRLRERYLGRVRLLP